MRSKTYSSVEKGIAAIAGIDPNNILAHEKVMLAEYITDAVKYVWDYYPWGEFTITEKRYFAEPYQDGKVYAVGDEVYKNKKYYRRYLEDKTDLEWQEYTHLWSIIQNITDKDDPEKLVYWHEIGDEDNSDDWTKDGFYLIGAKVKFASKLYICIQQPVDSEGVYIRTNYKYDNILPTDVTYWSPVTEYSRVIRYQQDGEETIGTMISSHTTDPRYSVAPPIDYREGREGIYFPSALKSNELWIKYRKESPIYTADSADEEIPNFLTPAIKAHAYKSFLIADGQNEKAVLQDNYVLDLLLREVDKINHQQDRGLGNVIYSDPYRRINSGGSTIANKTTSRIQGE